MGVVHAAAAGTWAAFRVREELSCRVRGRESPAITNASDERDVGGEAEGGDLHGAGRAVPALDEDAGGIWLVAAVIHIAIEPISGGYLSPRRSSFLTPVEMARLTI